MSEPGAGTDVLGMRTTARRDGDKYVLRGTKLWITNGTTQTPFLCPSLICARAACILVLSLRDRRGVSKSRWGLCVRAGTLDGKSTGDVFLVYAKVRSNRDRDRC